LRRRDPAPPFVVATAIALMSKMLSQCGQELSLIQIDTTRGRKQGRLYL
jgi:hypothetical protein